MKSIFTPLLITAASLIAVSAHAGVVSTFIPTEPTVTAPADEATDVDITPEFTSSNFAYTESDATATLSQSKWLVNTSDQNIVLLGGQKASNSYDGNNFEYDIPFNISISGQTATKINVTSSGDIKTVELLNDQDDLIARAFIELDGFYFQQDANFVLVKTFSNSLQLQWNLINSANVEFTAEFILLASADNNSDVFGWRTTPNELTNTLFDSQDSAAGCRVAIDSSNATFDSYDQDFADWKADLSGSYDKFFLVCSSSPVTGEVGQYDNALKELTTVDVVNFLPEITFTSSTTESVTLSDAESLNASTEYTAQVQHIGTGTSGTGYSNWSAPIAFTTRDADTNYEITVPSDLAFSTGEAKDLTFTIANTGSEEGAPQITIRLPFNALDVLNGTLSDYFNASVGSEDCAMTQSGGETNFICQLDSLAANAEAELAATITVADTSITSIEYQVCDTATCGTTEFTSVDITVADPTTATPASGGSSSGGSMFWLFLMAPLLLVRRKFNS